MLNKPVLGGAGFLLIKLALGAEKLLTNHQIWRTVLMIFNLIFWRFDMPDKQRYGVCCSCQSAHPVRRLGGVKEECVPADERNVTAWFVMEIHDCAGTHCNGSETEPQVLVD